jgi:hypothetical protein
MHAGLLDRAEARVLFQARQIIRGDVNHKIDAAGLQFR